MYFQIWLSVYSDCTKLAVWISDDRIRMVFPLCGNTVRSAVWCLASQDNSYRTLQKSLPHTKKRLSAALEAELLFHWWPIPKASYLPLQQAAVKTGLIKSWDDLLTAIPSQHIYFTHIWILCYKLGLHVQTWLTTHPARVCYHSAATELFLPIRKILSPSLGIKYRHTVCWLLHLRLCWKCGGSEAD